MDWIRRWYARSWNRNPRGTLTPSATSRDFAHAMLHRSNLPPTEEIARSISWGLMQVMGQVAREHGFQRPFLSALCDSSAGLTFGCIVLAAKLAAAGGNVPRGLALWNGGGNPDYAAQVLARVPRYR